MSESVYEKDGRRIVSAIDAMRRPSSTHPADLFDWSRSLVPVDLHLRQAYSYGRHFPLFRYIPRDGRRRELFVINGDEFGGRAGGWNSSRTPDHQASTRDAIAKCGADSLVIPFSALEGARIEIDSVRPVHVRPDKTWDETVTRSRLQDVPQWRRTFNVQVERTGARLDDVPESLRKVWRYANGTMENRDRERGPDGLYHWTVSETRELEPDADGLYRWQESRHRLGDCLFSAVRIGETARRRYLSSFDYEEPRPLYFLVQVPRGAGDTVETAIDSLAPRAVWAARARGLEVRRQGDIFFVETALTDDALSQRGIRSRVRLTQLDRDAAPRKGETGYLSETADERARRIARFHSFRRREWSRIMGEYRETAAARYFERYPWRADKRAKLQTTRAGIGRARDRISQGDSWEGYAGFTVENARASLARETARIVEISSESRASRRDRAVTAAKRLPTFNGADGANLTDGNRARAAWQRAHELALEKYGAPTMTRPHDYAAKVRRALSIYGTAHTAREVITVAGGAVYVRGKVSHRPALDSARASWDTAPDHRPLELDPAVWYLAIRNRVPRSRA